MRRKLALSILDAFILTLVAPVGLVCLDGDCKRYVYQLLFDPKAMHGFTAFYTLSLFFSYFILFWALFIFILFLLHLVERRLGREFVHFIHAIILISFILLLA